MGERSIPPWCDGYRFLLGQNLVPLMICALLQQQRPWHSVITLPSAGGSDEKSDQQKLEPTNRRKISSYDVDVFIMTIRLLLSLAFVAKGKHTYSDVVQCALHDFGWDMNADYAVKGALVSKLFPDEEDLSTLESKLTLDNLFEHPMVKEAIFGNSKFVLQSPYERIRVYGDQILEEVKTIPHDIDLSHIHWDGTIDIGEAVRNQACRVPPDPGHNYGRVRLRYSGRPAFIRVTYTPKSRDAPKFQQLRIFQLAAPFLVTTSDGGSRPVNGKDRYCLRAAIWVPPNEAPEIRIFDVGGNSVIPIKACNQEYMPMVNEKLRPEKDWVLGERGNRYILLYSSMGPPEAG
ncbi:hypothetical protein F5Y06DRAFT_280944 [Hypoxylon sp. FL0890]|nr:hypothetical protein F5Y06DRAFT_280944 [Hypoxylon sp. FL0890]